MNKRKGFTLVELIIASSILAIGIVFISRSFLTMVGALDTSYNRIKAIQFLDDKMSQLRLEVLEKKYIEQYQEQEQIQIGNREAKFKLNVEVLDLEDEMTLQEEIEAQIEKGETINIAQLSVSWSQEYREKEMSVSTYFLSNESVQDFGY
ncbi:MAG: prepilin-type N-terminal cleavage/methylation domain-containing protein [Candidatus Omnitrophota bacterium]|nr:prepilin-type N-terminal cleavage/methylation domain-containing protein [Candidatus Omnitrophota bacterium]